MSCHGYRGYISSRLSERSVPQNVQQTIIREYCRKNGLEFLLSATEYCMDGCTMMLASILQEKCAGIVFYSIFQLPEDSTRRVNLLRQLLRERKRTHFAAENMRIRSRDDIAKLEDIWLLKKLIS